MARRGSPGKSSTACPNLKFIAEVEGDRFSQRIDVDAAAERGITVVDTTNGSSYPVSEWALAMAMIGLRNAGALYRRMIAGEVLFQSNEQRVADPSFDGELTGRRVGLIGCGYIGRRLLELLAPFHCDILAFDPYAPRVLADIYDIKLTSLEAVMDCDVVISLVPLTPETRKMVGAREIALLRPGRGVRQRVARRRGRPGGADRAARGGRYHRLARRLRSRAARGGFAAAAAVERLSDAAYRRRDGAVRAALLDAGRRRDCP